MKVFAILCLVATSAFAHDPWEHYKTTFGKSYSAAEDRIRKNYFEYRMEQIDGHNLEFAEGQHLYSRGVNQFTDMVRETIVDKKLILI